MTIKSAVELFKNKFFYFARVLIGSILFHSIPRFSTTLHDTVIHKGTDTQTVGLWYNKQA